MTLILLLRGGLRPFIAQEGSRNGRGVRCLNDGLNDAQNTWTDVSAED